MSYSWLSSLHQFTYWNILIFCADFNFRFSRFIIHIYGRSCSVFFVHSCAYGLSRRSGTITLFIFRIIVLYLVMCYFSVYYDNTRCWVIQWKNNCIICGIGCRLSGIERRVSRIECHLPDITVAVVGLKISFEGLNITFEGLNATFGGLHVTFNSCVQRLEDWMLHSNESMVRS